MKKQIPFLLLMALLWIAKGTLQAQIVTSRTDSIVTYGFYGAEDSARRSIQIFHRIDSTYQYEYEWKGEWDADSGKWIPEARYSRALDQMGNQVLYTWCRWKGQYGWEPYDSIWRDYDVSGNLIFVDSYDWNYNQQDWTGEVREEHFRDGAGNDTLERKSTWDWMTNDWRYDKKNVNTYDPDHRQVESLYYEWNWYENFWIIYGGHRIEYILNVSGAVETMTYSGLELTDTTWLPYSKTEYVYDESGQLLSEEGYRLQEGEWVLKSKQEWIYDETGNIVLHTPHAWNYQLDTLECTMRYAYAYDGQGRKSVEDTQVWDPGLEEWLLNSRIEYSYNEKGDITLQNYSSWNVLAGGEFRQTRTEYLYNNAGQDSVTIQYGWNAGLEEIYLSSKMFYYYGVVDVKDYTGLISFSSAEFVLYPVPVGDVLRIESNQPVGAVELFDLNGRMVFNSGLVLEGVNLSFLNSGIYVIRLKDREGKLMGTRKIVKE